MVVGIVGYGSIGQAVERQIRAVIASSYWTSGNWSLTYNDSITDIVTYDVNPKSGAKVILEDSLYSLEKSLKGAPVDVLICTTPVDMVAPCARIANKLGISFLSVTEDIDTTRFVESCSWSLDVGYQSGVTLDANIVAIPQCGLAPGLVNILAANYIRQLGIENVATVKIRVGALPRSSTDPLRYTFSWSIDGVLNEYKKPCQIIRDGYPIIVPALEGYERLILDGREYEAFYTSGGLGSLASILNSSELKLDADYKSIRYVGHRDAFLQCDIKTEKLITQAQDDVVLIYIEVTTHKGVRRAFTKEVFGRNGYSAIQLTTALGVMVWLIELCRKHRKYYRGYVRQEDYGFNLKSINTIYNILVGREEFLPLDINGELL